MDKKHAPPGSFIGDTLGIGRMRTGTADRGSHGTHLKDIELELTITDTFLGHGDVRANPSVQFWQDLLSGQKGPITLTLEGAWVANVCGEPLFERDDSAKFQTKVRLLGKLLHTKGE